MERVLIEKLTSKYSPSHLAVENESHMHSSGLGAESHFKVLMVSDVFMGMSKVQRQRDVFATLAAEMKKIHALSLRLMTSEEQQKDLSSFESPLCHSKKR